MTLSVSLVLVILAVLVWIVVMVRRPRPFTVEVIDAVMFMLLAFYFR
jgi:hypothetical protein